MYQHLENLINLSFPNEQCKVLQNHPWAKDISITVQDRSVDFNVTECKKFTDTVSDSTWQLAFKNLPFVQFGYSIKEEYPQLSENAIKILLPFPSTYPCEKECSSYTSTKITYCSRVNAEADMRIQLSSIKSKRFVKIQNNTALLNKVCFVLEPIILFH